MNKGVKHNILQEACSQMSRYLMRFHVQLQYKLSNRASHACSLPRGTKYGDHTVRLVGYFSYLISAIIFITVLLLGTKNGAVKERRCALPKGRILEHSNH